MAGGSGAVPRPATLARPDALVELTHALRADLLRRGEFLPSSWVEEAAADLRAGRLIGWVLGEPAPTTLAFYSMRGPRAYAHIHVEPGPDAVDRTSQLIDQLIAALPREVARSDIGVTGLGEPEETSLAERVRHRDGFSVLERLAMDFTFRTGESAAPPAVPEGIQRLRVPDVPLDAIAALDWLAFQGTADESLVPETVQADREVLSEIVGGRLGRFLDEASTALVTPAGHLVGVLMSAEQSPRRAVFLDLVVHPAHRRRGIGAYLLEFGLRATRALGYSEVRLWVTAANTPARTLYERHGFQTTLRAYIYRFARGAAASSPQPQRGA